MPNTKKKNQAEIAVTKERELSLIELNEKLSLHSAKFHDYEYPKISIIIPTFNSSSHLPTTLDTLIAMQYIDYEIVIVDGGSIDRTVAIVKGYHSERIRLFTLSECGRYEMLNRGISEAAGEYIGFLFPGDYYISPFAFLYIFTDAIKKQYPEFLYCGTVIRGGREDVKVLYRKFSLSLLQKGLQPTSLQACFFHRKVFEQVGKFSSHLTMRGGFDLFCRIAKQPQIRSSSLSRILVDYDLRIVTKEMVFAHFKETFLCNFKYFGFWRTLIWLCTQKDLYRLYKVWLRSFLFALGIQR